MKFSKEGGVVLSIVFISILIIITLSFLLNNTNPRVVYSFDYTYNFDKSLTDSLATLYNENPNNEYSMCVNGNFVSQDLDEIFFTNFERLKIGEENSVNLVLCDSIGVLHNHPKNTCTGILNSADAEAAKVEFRNGVSFFMIQCDVNKFEIYNRENLYEGEIIEIN